MGFCHLIVDLQPLECGHEYRVAIQGEKLKKLTTHLLHQKLRNGTKKMKGKSFKPKLKDLQKEHADLLEAESGKCEELTTRGWASWKSLPEIRTEFQGLAAKGTQAPELHKALTLQMIAIPRAPGPMSSQMALLGMEAVIPTSVAQMEPPSPSPSKLVT